MRKVILAEYIEKFSLHLHYIFAARIHFLNALQIDQIIDSFVGNHLLDVLVELQNSFAVQNLFHFLLLFFQVAPVNRLAPIELPRRPRR